MEYLYMFSHRKVFQKENRALLKNQVPKERDLKNQSELLTLFLSFFDGELHQNTFMEFITSFIFAFFGQAAITSLIREDPKVEIFQVAFSQAIILALLIMVTIETSGGHVNPLVTFGLWTSGKIEFARMIFYIVAQIMGMYISQLALIPILGLQNEEIVQLNAISGPSYGQHTEFWQCFVLEFIGSFWFIFMIHAAAADENQANLFRKNNFSPLIIGTALFIGIYGTAKIIPGTSGAVFNPARALAPAFATQNYEKVWVFITAPALASIIHSSYYKCCSPFKKYD